MCKKCKKCLFNENGLCTIHDMNIDNEDEDFVEVYETCWFFRNYITMKTNKRYSDEYQYDDDNEVVLD